MLRESRLQVVASGYTSIVGFDTEVWEWLGRIDALAGVAGAIVGLVGLGRWIYRLRKERNELRVEVRQLRKEVLEAREAARVLPERLISRISALPFQDVAFLRIFARLALARDFQEYTGGISDLNSQIDRVLRHGRLRNLTLVRELLEYTIRGVVPSVPMWGREPEAEARSALVVQATQAYATLLNALGPGSNRSHQEHPEHLIQAKRFVRESIVDSSPDGRLAIVRSVLPVLLNADPLDTATQEAYERVLCDPTDDHIRAAAASGLTQIGGAVPAEVMLRLLAQAYQGARDTDSKNAWIRCTFQYTSRLRARFSHPHESALRQLEACAQALSTQNEHHHATGPLLDVLRQILHALDNLDEPGSR